MPTKSSHFLSSSSRCSRTRLQPFRRPIRTALPFSPPCERSCKCQRSGGSRRPPRARRRLLWAQAMRDDPDPHFIELPDGHRCSLQLDAGLLPTLACPHCPVTFPPHDGQPASCPARSASAGPQKFDWFLLGQPWKDLEPASRAHAACFPLSGGVRRAASPRADPTPLCAAPAEPAVGHAAFGSRRASAPPTPPSAISPSALPPRADRPPRPACRRRGPRQPRTRARPPARRRFQLAPAGPASTPEARCASLSDFGRYRSAAARLSPKADGAIQPYEASRGFTAAVSRRGALRCAHEGPRGGLALLRAALGALGNSFVVAIARGGLSAALFARRVRTPSRPLEDSDEVGSAVLARISPLRPFGPDLWRLAAPGRPAAILCRTAGFLNLPLALAGRPPRPPPCCLTTRAPPAPIGPVGLGFNGPTSLPAHGGPLRPGAGQRLALVPRPAARCSRFVR